MSATHAQETCTRSLHAFVFLYKFEHSSTLGQELELCNVIGRPVVIVFVVIFSVVFRNMFYLVSLEMEWKNDEIGVLTRLTPTVAIWVQL